MEGRGVSFLSVIVVSGHKEVHTRYMVVVVLGDSYRTRMGSG